MPILATHPLERTMALLRAADGPTAGREFRLGEGESIMGRHPDCDIIVDAGAVSRHHARLYRKDDLFFVEDLDSRNGTFVNDRQIDKPFGLHPGDTIRICDLSFRFQGDTQPGSIHATPGIDGSGYAPMLVDDSATGGLGTIMSKIDVSLSGRGLQISASPEVKLAALLEITSSLVRALALDEVLPKLLEGLFKIFVQADRGFIVMHDDRGHVVPRWTKLRRENTDDSLRISRTIVNSVMETKEAILSADAANDERFEMSESIADFSIRSMMCAPLVNADGEAFGVLQIDTLNQRQRFQAEDLEVLVGVAAQAAIAITNAQFHEDALRQRDLQRDLELAHEVQTGLLPGEPPNVDRYNFFAFYGAANHVGGDYYDYVPLPDGKIAVIVADVVGHGVAAALLMARLSAEARFCLAQQMTPADTVTQLNSTFSRAAVEDRFVTLLLAVLDTQSNEITVVNAGHMNPIIRHADGSIDEPGDDEAGLPVGVTDSFDYDQFTLSLTAGDTVAMYTDGLNEALDQQGTLYGMDRLREQITAAPADPDQMGAHLIDDVKLHIGSRDQNDDMCLVCFGRKE